MRHSLKRKYVLLILFLLTFTLPCFAISIPSGINTQNSQTKEQDEENKMPMEPPEVILNDQKIIFNKKPILDEEGWLFPLEEIALKLQSKITVDIVNGTITIQRNQDKSIVQLNVKNGVVTINNSPFRTLFGFNRIILGKDTQMVPTSALVILLGLTSKDDEENKLILKNNVRNGESVVGTVQPQARQGFKDLLNDFLTVTNSFNWFKTQDFTQRRTEITSGFHNDNYALTSDFILKSGTGAPIINFDSGNFSYYKNASPFQIHVGDKPLSLVKSPLLGGITMRGVQIQTEGKSKGSKMVFNAGLLPTNSKVLGTNLAFVRYGRAAEVIEWSSSPFKNWQFSFGEATYSDLLTNLLVMSKQSGGLLAASITKTGKYIEGDSNISFGTSTNKITGKQEQGPGADLLVRIKPKDWFSIFTKGAYYSPEYFALSSNPYFHDRNEATVGFNLTPPRSNIGVSHSVGKYNLNAEDPNSYSVTNIFASTTPFKKGPTLLTSYSNNESQISSTRAIDNLLFPINQSNISTVDLETLIERRTNSFFRASLLKSWKTINVTSSINQFTFANNSPLKTPLIGEEAVTKLFTYDLNINKYINRFIGFQNYFQGSELYKQIKFGINLASLLSNKLNMQLSTGALIQAKDNPQPIYGLNLSYQLNKKTNLSLNLDKTPFTTNVSALYQYNLRPTHSGQFTGLGEEQSIGRIRGRVLVLDEPDKKQAPENKLALLGSSRERGIGNVRVHLGNFTIKTNELGVFEFPSLTSGIHKLRVEYSDLPSYLTSITPESVDVNVEAGKETNFNFVLAYFGSLSGKIQLVNEPSIKLEEEPQLQDIRVYLDGSEFETLTNLDGTFILGDVKPGKYKLKVDPDYLPKELEIDQKEIVIDVHGKDKIENIELPIKYKTKPQEIKEF